MKKYEVTFKQSIGDFKSSVVVVKDLKLEDAVQFALNLHRSSNCSHVISVYFDSSSDNPLSPVVEFFSEE